MNENLMATDVPDTTLSNAEGYDTNLNEAPLDLLSADDWSFYRRVLAYRRQPPSQAQDAGNVEVQQAVEQLEWATRAYSLLLDRQTTIHYQPNQERDDVTTQPLYLKIEQATNDFLGLLTIPKLHGNDPRIKGLVDDLAGQESLDQFDELFAWAQKAALGQAGISEPMTRILRYLMPELLLVQSDGKPVYHVSLRKYLANRLLCYCEAHDLRPAVGTLADYEERLTPEALDQYLTTPCIEFLISSEASKARLAQRLNHDKFGSGYYHALKS